MLYVENAKQAIKKVNDYGTTGGTLVSSDTELDITGLKYNTTPTQLGLIGTTPTITNIIQEI